MDQKTHETLFITNNRLLTSLLKVISVTWLHCLFYDRNPDDAGSERIFIAVYNV